MSALKPFFWFTDLGMLLYWSVTALALIPAEYAYSDYKNPLLVAWNWSFFPLDLLISLTGLFSLFLYSRRSSLWRGMALVSLTLTFVSGLNAVSFWAIRGDFAPEWWFATARPGVASFSGARGARPIHADIAAAQCGAS